MNNLIKSSIGHITKGAKASSGVSTFAN
ncbi:sugar-binding protein, partial [Bacillus cereus]